MNKNEKKASDIIVELQEQVETLIRLVNNQNYILNLLLQKSNLPNKENKENKENKKNIPVQSVTTPSNQSPQEPSIKKSKFAEGGDAIAMKAQHARQQDNNSRFEQMKAQMDVSEDNNFNLEEASSPQGHRRGERVSRQAKPEPEKKISVSQQVIDLDGKPLPLATVKVTDQFGQIVKSARSNAKGKWNAPLSPGLYSIYVLKKFVSDPDKKPVEMEYSISIPNTDNTSIELPPNSED